MTFQGPCRRCTRLTNRALPRRMKSVYWLMLQRLRRDENFIDDNENFDRDLPPSIMCFLIDDEDMQYLVDVIWGGQSALSGESDRWNLVACRWDSQVAWSPWNCVLLTVDEAEAHRRLPSLDVCHYSTTDKDLSVEYVGVP